MSKGIISGLLSYRGNCGGCHYPDASAIRTEGVTARYASTGTPALNGVSLCVKRGERLALVGDNGSGKSTLLKCLADLLPYEGEIRILGHRPGVCRHEVAYLPQRSSLDWEFPISLSRFVLTGTYVRLGWLRRPGREQRTLAAQALDSLGLSPYAGRQIGSLSGGQQQRALLARTLLHDAELYLLDEPFNAVDETSRGLIWEALDRLKERGCTVVMATHDIAHFMDRFDRVLTLENGCVSPD
ncbi:ABC transporter ATP-binding protein [Ruficoccus amylovorans]|uniref:ABC transporter ATP-binding protein n=1 Tax=Ruficoccus amylovorans TaxID=1804625 RepID=A0A842HDI6_9BACT|nr:ABC transporter ATP-binding protein [Ruficoccus amylovorans]MBC2594280.1 ABC transporter ATP-binding protein [Ruficoccus amylovorans]